MAMTDDEKLTTHAHALSNDEFWISRPADHYDRAESLRYIDMCLDLGIPVSDTIDPSNVLALYDRLVAVEARLTALETP